MTSSRTSHGKIADELRKRFRTPREALKALGLDQSLLDVPRRLAFDGATHMRPTKLEFLALKNTAAAINPMLSMDAKVEYGPIFKGLTTANFKRRKPQIVADIKRLIKGKTIAKDASVEHLAHMLDQFEHTEEPKSLDESVSEPQHKAMEAAAHGKSNLGIPKKVGEEFSEKDKGKGFDRKSFDEFMKSKGATEDALKSIHDMIRDELPENALDEWDDEEAEEEVEDEDMDGEDESEEEREKEKEREAEDRRGRSRDSRVGKDRPARDRQGKDRKGAMDEAAIERIVSAAVAQDRKQQNSVIETREFVYPYVGKLPIALDSAKRVLVSAAKILGIDEAEKINEEGLRALIRRHPVAGARPDAAYGYGRQPLTEDSIDGGASESASRWPDADRIGRA